MTETHPRHALDKTLQAPVRLSIVAMLAGMDKAEFALVRDSVEVSDSALSKQSTNLENAGYLKITKGFVGKRPRTWFSLTEKGREAFNQHVQALKRIADDAD